MALAGLAAGAEGLRAAEITALHLELDKPIPMRRAEATAYLPWVEPLAEPDPEGESGALLSCAVLPTGARGRQVGTGELHLRLLGERGDEPWESSSVVEGLDARGEASFGIAEIAGLADEAPGGTSIELFEVVWRGGRGKKVASVTIDCAAEAAP